jgi:hypothetical protein
MRPSPQELAEGIRGLLREAGAEVTSLKGKQALRRAMVALRDQAWNEAAFDLMSENALVAGLIGETSQWLEKEGAPPADASPAGEAGPPRSYEEAERRNRDLRGHLVELLDALSTLDLPASAELRRGAARTLLAFRTRAGGGS